ncbi:MAG: adenylyltransferase/cytidyltransferase family protein [Burkholderiales bacterium]|nr:adenylyltransferase/cytidyltransferase family protein [Burkholderiales bacterium]
MNKKYKIAITYGTFDLFHIGHLNLLKRMKSLATHVIVGVCSDEFCLNKIVKKQTTYSTEERVAIISSIKYVDSVILENNSDQKLSDIIKYNVDLFVIGDDWQGKFDHFKNHCDVLYLKRTQNISTTKIKELIKNA